MGHVIRNVIVGTAGHIDHGKSSVVRALTGIDPDRLAEEHERGMTIDLGFAPYAHSSGATVGMIDVPGHERFIKNMVAGATSVDVAMLVVAADDGVMPQTREHLEILKLLGVKRGLIVLNKIDLVDEELLELVLEDIKDLVSGTFLESAEVLPVSVVTESGFDDLRISLDSLVSAVTPHASEGPFRLPVQRVFTVPGHGLVVTGVPMSGQVSPGDQLEIVHSGLSVRVRGIHAYGRATEDGRAGHSTALNLVGANREDVTRGDVVAMPGVFRSTRFIAVDYRHTHGETPLRHRHPVRVHSGTAEVQGRATLLDSGLLESGVEAPVQLRVDHAMCVAPGDRLIVRDAASMVVLGGGLVLEAGDGRLKRFKDRVLYELRSRRETLENPARLAQAIIASAGPRGVRLNDVALEVGRSTTELRQDLVGALEEGDLVVVAGDHYLTSVAATQVADELVAALKGVHRKHPLLDWVDLSTLRSSVPYGESAVQAALACDERLEIASGGRVRRRGHRGRLTPQLEAAREHVVESLRAAAARPPSIDSDFTGLSEKDHRALMDMLRSAGIVVLVGGLLFHRDALDHMRKTLVAHGREREGSIHIPDLRDDLNTSRKYLIPLLEYFDAERLTVRHGDQRVLRSGVLEGRDDAPTSDDEGDIP